MLNKIFLLLHLLEGCEYSSNHRCREDVLPHLLLAYLQNQFLNMTSLAKVSGLCGLKGLLDLVEWANLEVGISGGGSSGTGGCSSAGGPPPVICI